MTDIAITGARVAGESGGPTSILVRDGTIAGVGGPVAGAERLMDSSGWIVAPGFVDLQCNGAHGIDLATDPERLWELAAVLPTYGVTAFCPTIISSPLAIVDRAMRALGERPAGYVGAEPLGLHLEGPMLSPSRRGAHRARWLRSPADCPLDRWRRDAGIALVTLAPELDGAPDAVRALVANGVVVAAGHSEAGVEPTLAGVDAGITAITHLFNAMGPFDHHSPGIAAVALSDSRLTAGLIADGVHVHPAAVAASWAALQPDRAVLVTDSSPALGAGDGDSYLGGIPNVTRADRVLTPDGRLAGSVLPMDQAVRNLVSFTGCSADRAIACATEVPARLVRAVGKGRVEVGSDADLVLLGENLEVVAVMVGGRVVRSGGPWV